MGLGLSSGFIGRSTAIDWLSLGRGRIFNYITGRLTKPGFKPCLECRINIGLENFGLCKKCWDNACRELQICAVCYEPTIRMDDDVEDLLKKWGGRWKRIYCSEKCKGISKSRRWRKENPEKKQMSNLKYLKDIEKDLKKTLKVKK